MTTIEDAEIRPPNSDLSGHTNTILLIGGTLDLQLFLEPTLPG
jgi:hypothetical protein